MPLPITATEAELDVMAHRYLYYVLSEPTITDWAYDQLEREARNMPELVDSKIQDVGSSLASSYTPEQVVRAQYFLNGH